jgi:hypothetical protein
VTLPSAKIPAPSSGVLPFLMVTPLKVMSPAVILNTRLMLLPSIIVLVAPLPVMVKPAGSVTVNSPLVRLMMKLLLKVIVSAPARSLAVNIANLREPAPLSFPLVTIRLEKSGGLGMGLMDCTSNAPMSTVPPTILANPAPRWSVVTPDGIKALFPALIAGLPGKRAWVWVAPPLSAKGASRGSTGLLAVPTRELAGNVASNPVLMPIKLLPALV